MARYTGLSKSFISGLDLRVPLGPFSTELLRDRHMMTSRLDEVRANLVFFDVQEGQRPGVDSIARAARVELIQETPMIIMRIASINDLKLNAQRCTFSRPK